MMGIAASLMRRYAARGRGCEEKTEEYKAMAANAKEAAFSYVLAKNCTSSVFVLFIRRPQTNQSMNLLTHMIWYVQGEKQRWHSARSLPTPSRFVCDSA